MRPGEPDWDALAEARDNDLHRIHYGYCLDECRHPECQDRDEGPEDDEEETT